MIPMFDMVTLIHAGESDKWGIQSGASEVEVKARLKCRMTELDTGDKQVVPRGSVILDGTNSIKFSDRFRFTAPDGNTYTVKPDEIKVISDINNKPLFVKVSF